MKLNTSLNKLLSGVVLGGMMLGLTACNTTHQVSESPKDFSGFLEDYSLLTKSDGNEANYVYIDHAVNWAKYTKVYIKNVDLWKSQDADSQLGKLSSDNQQMLVNFVHTSLATALATNFTIVDAAGPGVLVIHAAVTDAKKSWPVVNLVSTVYPAALVLSYVKQGFTGTGTGVGLVRVEAEFTDGVTGQRVAAAVDERAGTKALRTKFDGTWGDVKLCFDWWSARLDERLQLLKTGNFSDKTL